MPTTTRGSRADRSRCPAGLTASHGRADPQAPPRVSARRGQRRPPPVEVPSSPPAPERPAPPGSPAAAAGGAGRTLEECGVALKVLFVDDEPDLAPLIRQTFAGRRVREGRHQARLRGGRGGGPRASRRGPGDRDHRHGRGHCPGGGRPDAAQPPPQERERSHKAIVVTAYRDMENIRTAEMSGSLRLPDEAHRPDGGGDDDRQRPHVSSSASARRRWSARCSAATSPMRSPGLCSRIPGYYRASAKRGDPPDVETSPASRRWREGLEPERVVNYSTYTSPG